MRSSAGEGGEQEGVTEVGASSIAPNEGLHGEASGDSSLSPRPLSEASFGSVQVSRQSSDVRFTSVRHYIIYTQFNIVCVYTYVRCSLYIIV